MAYSWTDSDPWQAGLKRNRLEDESRRASYALSGARERIEELEKALETAISLLNEHTPGLEPRIEALEKILKDDDR